MTSAESTKSSLAVVPRLFSFILELSPMLSRLIVIAVSLILSGASYFFFPVSLSLLEERIGSLGWTFSPDKQLEERVILVAIDERSIAEIGPWPWPREKMAELVNAVDSAGAQLQIHDIVYSESKIGDEDLIAALRSSSGVVVAQIPVLAANSPDTASIANIRTGEMTHPLTGIECQPPNGDGSVFPSSSNFIAADTAFSDISKGHITPLVNVDGSVSKQPAVVCVEGRPYPALALAALQKASGRGDALDLGFSARVEKSGGLFAPYQKFTLDSYPGLAIPLDRDGNFRVSYASHPSSYQALSASDVLNGTLDLSILDGAWVLIGATAFGMDDVIPTPYSGATPGVELQARILASILDVEMPYTPRGSSLILTILCLLFAGLTVKMPDWAGRGIGFLPWLIVLFPLVSLFIHSQALSSLSLWLGWLFPALFGCIAAGLALVLEQARVSDQRNRILVNLESYLPSDAAEQIAYSLPNSNIKAVRREVTLLSADLRNFSAYTEARPAEESAAVLHFFFQRATEIVEDCGGRIYEFSGDGLLAVWDSHGVESAELAYRAANRMLEHINHQLLEEYAPKGLEPLVLGVGIEQGPALIGSIGPAHRRAHTLLGDTVTIALRVQEMTADLSQPLLLGECVSRHIESAALQSQGSYLLAGLVNPHTLFAPAPTESSSSEKMDRPKLVVLSGGRQ
jgi:CHASE2 domain-containing sensor protein/class 3 adenylate cyclase